MVMRNSYDRPGGRDDLPPRIADRLRAWPIPQPVARPQPAPPARPKWARDLAWFMLLFLAVAAGSILYVLAALFYISP
jgi:hypothetical protein